MKILYVDLETTGLDRELDQILEVGMVIDDLANQQPIDTLPTFRRVIRRERYTGQPYALAMHAGLLRAAAGVTSPALPIGTLINERSLATDAEDWLDDHWKGGQRITVGGKNVAGFDMPFLGMLPGFARDGSRLRIGGYSLGARTVDPAVLFVRPGDAHLPDLDECCRRAGLPGRTDHTAVGDCLLVAALVRASGLGKAFVTNAEGGEA